MNSHKREERRIHSERRQDLEVERNLPELNRAHRDCEQECLYNRAHIKKLESLLARAGDELQWLRPYAKTRGTDELIAEIDAILPAKEE